MASYISYQLPTVDLVAKALVCTGWWHAVLPNLTNTNDPPGCNHPPDAPHPGAPSCKNTNSSLFDILYKEDATPKGMAGYWTLPASRSEARNYVKAYFDERKGSIANLKPGKFHSITCISHYEMYAAAWGVDMIGLELGCQVRLFCRCELRVLAFVPPTDNHNFHHISNTDRALMVFMSCSTTKHRWRWHARGHGARGDQPMLA